MTTQITTDNIAPATLEVLGSGVPKVSTIAYPGDDNAANPAGGDTITLTGTGFVAGATVIINGTSAGVVTVVSGTTLTFTAPASSAGTYVIYVINSDGGTAIVIPGISYSGLPNWSTNAGSLGNIYEVSNVNTTVVATGDVPITYSLYSGNLPAGSNINGSTGLISGTAPAAGSPTTYSFVIKATDNEQQDTNRSFSLTINPDTVAWISPANASVTTSYEYANISNVSLSANTESNTSVSFSQSGLPAGFSLTGNTISGSSNTVANTSVTLTATGNVAGRTATRTVYFNVQQDVVTWSSPANNTTYESFTNSAISNVSLSASSAGGQSITYTANTLPTGVTVSGSVISGTATDAANTTTLLTATSALSNRTATRTINWVISVANDPYFKNVSLLLNGETTAIPFINDASTNSFALTINGDTKPNNFNPYQGEYYSNYFDGTGDYLTVPDNTALESFTDFTIEFWVYFNSVAGSQVIVDKGWNGAAFSPYLIFLSSGSLVTFASADGGTWNVLSGSSFGTPSINTWYHIALTRSGSSIRLFRDGVVITTVTNSSTLMNSTSALGIGGSPSAGANPFNGYISNLRIVKGTAVYTSAFTPSTTPLTAIENTSLLTCQSNRFIDNSTNNFTITKFGDTTVSSVIPFTPNSSYSTYGSAYFDGTGDYLTAPSNVALNLTGDFTIEFWAYPTASIASKSIAGTTSSSMHFDSGGAFYLINSTSQYLRATDFSFLTLNTWTHVAITRSGSTLKFFRNGVDNGIGENVGSANTATFTFSGLNIGYSPHVNASSYLTGYISNFRIVKGTGVYSANFTPPTSPLTAIANTSLLTLQTNQSVNNNIFLDQSSFNNIVTRNGNTSQGTFSPYSVTGWSNFFDGTGDYLILSGTPANFGTGDFLIEGWIYMTGTGGGYPQFLSANGTTDCQFGFNSNTSIYFFPGGATYSASYTFVLNTWYHVAWSRVSGTIRIFVDGVQRTSFSYSTAINLGTALIGGYAGGTANGAFQGYISNLRVLVGTGVTTITVSTSPLTAIANTSLLTCQSNRLIDNSINNFTLTRAGDVSVQALDPFGSVPEAVPISYSVYFDGTGDWLTFTSATTGSGNFTTEAWINLSSLKDYQVIFDNRATGGTSTGYALGVDAAGKPYLYTNSGFQILSSIIIGISTWNHLALVRSGTTITLYVNGVSGGTYTSSANFSDTNNGIGIAPTYTPTSQYFGYISNLRIVNGTAVYTSAFTPSTTPLTAIANTSLLTCQSTRMIDNSTNNFTLTATGNTTPRIFNPFGYTAQSVTSYTPSLQGGSAYFDGSVDYLTTASSSQLSFGTGDFTIECWVYANGFGESNSGTVWFISSGTVFLRYQNTTTWAFYDAGGVRRDYTFNSTNSGQNQWVHHAIVRSSSTTTWYINGTSVYSGADTASYNGTIIDIGRYPGAGLYWNGYVSNFRVVKGTAVYTSNFIPPTTPTTSTNNTTLLLNFNNGGIIDQHGTNVLETVGNAQLSTAVKKYGSASMYFDGTGDGLLSPSSINFDFGTGNFTIEMWINLTNVTSAWQAIISRAYNISGGWRLYKYDASNQLAWYGGDSVINTTGSTLANNTWSHIAVVRNSGTTTVYIDGVNRGSAADTRNYNPGNYAVEIGRGVVTSEYPVTGYIDDLRITKGYARYTSNFTPPTALITK